MAVAVLSFAGAHGQQKVVKSQITTIVAQGDMTATGVIDTTVHTWYSVVPIGQSNAGQIQMPLQSPLDSTTHAAKVADTVQLKVMSEVNEIGFQVDLTQYSHNATGADSTTVTIYGSKAGGGWQYSGGGWVQLQQTTLTNQTAIQSINFDVNSSGVGGNPFTNYFIVVKVGETYAGTAVKWKAWCLWR